MIPEACQCAEYCLGLNTFSFFPICCFIKVAYTSVTSLTIQKIMEMVKKKKKNQSQVGHGKTQLYAFFCFSIMNGFPNASWDSLTDLDIK